MDFLEDSESFGGRFRIGQAFLESGPLIFGQKKAFNAPYGQFCLDDLLGFHVRTDHPDCRIDMA